MPEDGRGGGGGGGGGGDANVIGFQIFLVPSTLLYCIPNIIEWFLINAIEYDRDRYCGHDQDNK
jgi:hypothetical protein